MARDIRSTQVCGRRQTLWEYAMSMNQEKKNHVFTQVVWLFLGDAVVGNLLCAAC